MFRKIPIVIPHFFPVRRGDDSQLHLSLEVRLIETRNNSVGIVRLKLSIYVLFFIHIDKGHTPIAIIGIRARVVHYDHVAILQLGSLKMNKSIDMLDFNGLSVLHDSGYMISLEVQDKLIGLMGQIEYDFRVT